MGSWKVRVRQLSLLCVLLGGLAGCYTVKTPKVEMLNSIRLKVGITNIKDIQRQPQAGNTVYLSGTVGREVPLVGARLYELKDSTGSIWVKTQSAVPSTGASVTLRGQVHFKSIPLGGKDHGDLYVEEQEQLNASL